MPHTLFHGWTTVQRGEYIVEEGEIISAGSVIYPADGDAVGDGLSTERVTVGIDPVRLKFRREGTLPTETSMTNVRVKIENRPAWLRVWRVRSTKIPSKVQIQSDPRHTFVVLFSHLVVSFP